LSAIYNVYCDESCHLQHDSQPIMVLGAVWCPLEHVRPATLRLREIKAKHGLAPQAELKWTKLAPANLAMYLEVLDYFFDTDGLSFRALVADKRHLRHEEFGQTHDDWYFKMYFDLLKFILEPGSSFRIYLDLKDTRSAAKIRHLHDVLAHNLYDFSRDIVERVQAVRSHEVELMQLSDVLIGAVSTANRSSAASPAKGAFVERMRQRSRYTLLRSTLLRERKVNLFHWQGASAAQE
jgi:hypothetical protein